MFAVTAALFLVVSRRARHEGAAFAGFEFGFGLSAAGDVGLADDFCSGFDAACYFSVASVTDTCADGVGSEDIAFLGPQLVFTFAVVDDGISSYNGTGGGEAQGSGRYTVYTTFVQRVDSDVGCQTRLQFQVRIGS